jgi:hypothetical protein
VIQTPRQPHLGTAVGEAVTKANEKTWRRSTNLTRDNGNLQAAIARLGHEVVDEVIRYTATAHHVAGWWIVQCDQHPGALSQVRRLDQAADVHREAIAFVVGVPADEV